MLKQTFTLKAGQM